MKWLKINQDKNFSYVNLSRADVRNAFNPEMIKEITEYFQNANKLTSRAIILRGEGKVFCAGGDLHWMREMVNYSVEQNKKDAELLYEMFSAVSNCPIPIIAVVHGAAFGGALGLVACCDYVIAEEKTQFCLSEVKLGIAPAVISKFLLKKSSLGHLLPLMLTGKVFGVSEAIRAGLVHEASDEESIEDRVLTTVNFFKEVGPQAARATKKLSQELNFSNEEQGKKLATQLIAELRVGTEGQEGLKAFLEKRKPSWRLD